MKDVLNLKTISDVDYVGRNEWTCDCTITTFGLGVNGYLVLVSTPAVTVILQT